MDSGVGASVELVDNLTRCRSNGKYMLQNRNVALANAGKRKSYTLKVNLEGVEYDYDNVSSASRGRGRGCADDVLIDAGVSVKSK